MSKQSEAKIKQGYIGKPTPRTCMHCKHFRSEKIKMETPWGEYTKETLMRCGVGGFAVKKMGTCNVWAGVNPTSRHGVSPKEMDQQ